MVSAEQIEEALELLFTGDGKFQLVEVGARPNGLRIPGINWAVTAGSFENVARMVTQNFEITGMLLVKNVSAERERRKSIHPVVLYVIQKTMFETLGLDMNAIQPVRWEDATDNDDYSNSLMRVLIRLKCKSGVTKLPSGEVEQLLLGIDTALMIKPGDDTADAGDNINLQGA